MTSRERLTRLFEGKDIDRVPIWLLAPYHKVGYYADIYNNPYYKTIVQRIEQGDCDTFDRRNFDKGFAYNPNLMTKTIEWTENGNHITETIMKHGNFELRKSITRGETTTVKYYIDDVDDLDILDAIAAIPSVPVRPDLTSFFKEQAELGDKGLMMPDLGDPLGVLYHLMSAENFSMATAIDYDRLLSFLDIIQKRVYDYYKYFLDNNAGDIFFIVGCEFAGPPLVAPEKFSEMSVRYVKGIVDLIRSYGKKSIVHYHGNLFKIRNGIKEMNPDGLHTIEAPPIGDCTIAEAREVLGDMVLIGNVQYDDISRCSKEQIDAYVKTAMDEGKSGRFILSPSAGPYEEILSDKQIENYHAFIDAGLKYGKY